MDNVCNGTGWLWEDAYGNRITCWRCAGSGTIGDIQNKQNGPISRQDQDDEDATI